MQEFLQSLFREDLVPHGYCIAWQPEILWLHVISDAFIALAYYSIPITLLYFVRRRPDFPFRGMIYLFIGFIFACGGTHLIEIVTIWRPIYGIEGVAKALTAGVSVVAAILLIPTTPRALALRNPEELEALNQKLRAEMAARQREAEERRRLDARIGDTQRLESLGTMAAGVAHDFNNLLTVISGHAEFVKSRCADHDESCEDIDHVLRAAAAAADLSAQMLTYAGCDTEATRPINVNRTVAGLTLLLGAAVPPKVQVAYSLMDNLPEVRAGSAQIRQVVMNLVLNASEALAERDGLISVSTGLTRLSDEPGDGVRHSFLESDSEPCVFLQVADTAGGMSLETQRRIFDPFFSTKTTGRGLGLSVVLGVVKARGGAVLLRSQSGKGSVFRVLFSAAGMVAKTAADPPREQARSEPGDSGIVLIVDDNDSVRNLVKTVLSRAGYAVQSVSNGVEALQVLETQRDKIGLVFLDVSMPVMSGIEVLQAIRMGGLRVPVILASGYDEGRGWGNMTADTETMFLGKPFTPNALLEAVRRSTQP
jgi:signal transduction histidine kinase/CheY-like chemotaxis protein